MSDNPAANRKPRNIITGVVTKCSSAKTVLIVVSAKVKHAVFGKYETKKQKFHVHDEKGVCKVGDLVRAMETKPLSKNKRHRLVEIIKH